jgi:hypothetical protein
MYEDKKVYLMLMYEDKKVDRIILNRKVDRIILNTLLCLPL